MQSDSKLTSAYKVLYLSLFYCRKNEHVIGKNNFMLHDGQTNFSIPNTVAPLKIPFFFLEKYNHVQTEYFCDYLNISKRKSISFSGTTLQAQTDASLENPISSEIVKVCENIYILSGRIYASSFLPSTYISSLGK